MFLFLLTIKINIVISNCFENINALFYSLIINHCSITCDMPARRPARKPGLIQRMIDDRLRYIFLKKSVENLGGRVQSTLLDWWYFPFFWICLPIDSVQNTATGRKRIGADVCSPTSPPSVCCRRWVPGGSGVFVESLDSCSSISARDSVSPRELLCGAAFLNVAGRETWSSLTRRRPCGRTDTSKFWRARLSPPWRPTDRSLTSRTR